MAGRRSKNDRGAPVKKMISNKKLRSSLSRVPIYTILLACLTSLFINWFVVLETSDRIEKKVTEDAYRDGMFSWKGFLYYQWALADIDPRLATMVKELPKLQATGRREGPEAA